VVYATHCNVLQRTATHCNTYVDPTTRCCRLQCVAVHCFVSRQSLCLSSCSLSCYSLFHCSLSLRLSLLLCHSSSPTLLLLPARANVFLPPQVLTVMISCLFVIKRCYLPIATKQYIQYKRISKYSCIHLPKHNPRSRNPETDNSKRRTQGTKQTSKKSKIPKSSKCMYPLQDFSRLAL